MRSVSPVPRPRITPACGASQISSAGAPSGPVPRHSPAIHATSASDDDDDDAPPQAERRSKATDAPNRGLMRCVLPSNRGMSQPPETAITRASVRPVEQPAAGALVPRGTRYEPIVYRPSRLWTWIYDRFFRHIVPDAQ